MTRGLDAWVYRDGRRRVAGRRAFNDLARRLGLVERLVGESRRREALDALVLAGMIESALADAGVSSVTDVAAVTDDLARIALGEEVGVESHARRIGGSAPPHVLSLGSPEGFAYYGLHPEAYGRAVESVYGLGEVGAHDHEHVHGRTLVVGIRSIGTTLSAVACAALRGKNVDAERITVRPTGHPFDRELRLEGEAKRQVDRAASDRAVVLVVDEGPGLSGSTFLATAEAIAKAGVPRTRIIVVCSHEPDTSRLAATNAAERWRSFRVVVAPNCIRAPTAGIDVSGGGWREHSFVDEREWPAVFASSERRKLRMNGRLYKYEGLGPSGEAVRLRADALARAGWGPAVRDEGDGWCSYPWLGGRSGSDVPPLATIARYCAERPELCPPSEDVEDLRPMVEKNVAVLLGAPREVPSLEVVRPAVVDARMAPHEWVSQTKVDAVADGDGHFFPGTTDIAWDLAGVIVEHGLDATSTRAFLDAYRRASGDDARARIGAWVLAYAAFHGALASLARESARRTPEEPRLTARIEQCAAHVSRVLPP